MPRPTKFEAAQLKRPKSPKTPGKNKLNRKLGNSRGNSPDAVDMITLSSGSERGASPNEGEDESGSLDNLGDYQSCGTKPRRIPNHNRPASPKSTRNTKTARESDESLSDGEIREGDNVPSPGETSLRSPNPNIRKTSGNNRKVGSDTPKSPLPNAKTKKEVKSLLSKVEKGAGKKKKPKLAIGINLANLSPPEPANAGFVEDVAPVASDSSDDDYEKPSGRDVTEKPPKRRSEEKEALALVQVTYLNKYIAEKYDSAFRKLVAGILSKERDNMAEIRAAAQNEKTVTIVYHDCFEEDTNAEKVTKRSKNQSSANLYGLRDDFIPDLPVNSPPEDAEDLDSPAATPKLTPSFSRQKECFNCGGNHILSQCTEPVDYVRISAKRQQFMNTSSPMMNSGRYHESNAEEGDRIKPGEFPDCVPGQISDELMAALGLTRRDVPPWVYRMRACGYPPGYVRDCVVETSGLNFVTEDSQPDLEPAKVQYDLSKLPRFPGFSAPHTPDVLKSLINHRDQPHSHQSHETILSFLGQMAVKNAVEPKSPSPDIPNGGEDMDMSEEEVVVNGTRNEESADDDEDADSSKFVDEWVRPASPNATDQAQNGSRVPSKDASGLPSLGHSSSVPNVSSVSREERLELLVESPSAPPVTRRDAPLLKTSSVPELGSFSGLGDLPENHKFAEGVAPWPFEEATQNTGRYNLIREALEATRKRKHSS